MGYISLNARKMAYQDAVKSTNHFVLNSASNIKDKLNYDMSIAITLANSFQIYDDYEKDEWQTLINKMYLNIYNNNPQIYGLWDSWELSAIDSTHTKNYGRIANSYWRDNGLAKFDSDLRSMDGDSELYLETKSMLIPSINEPYFDIVTTGKQESLMLTSLNAPVVKNGEYKAVVSMDITLSAIQDIVNEIKPYPGSYAYMVTYGGKLAGHSNTEYLNVPLIDIYSEEVTENSVLSKIQNGKLFSYNKYDSEGNKLYVTYAPILVNMTDTPWSICIVVPEKSMMVEATKNFRISLLAGLIGIFLMFIIIYFIGRFIAKPIVKITGLLKQLSVGNVDKSLKIDMNSGDELEEMTESANLLIDGLSKTAEFAKTIGQGNLLAEYEKTGDNDILGEALLEMRQSLVNAEEDEKNRKVEDEKINWATQGQAKFGEILRMHDQNIHELTFNFMSNLVDYVDAIQGALFIKNDDSEDDEFFELVGAIAYDRKKTLDSKFKLGEGLIGRCAYERLTIYMEEVPDNYVHVTSGLGESNPRSILLVPAILNEKVYGIIELISFNKIDKYKIDFVERIGESIASTISTVKINDRTQILLQQSKQQSEELAAQEEEMRQNLEELQATQEEVGRLREEDQIKNKKMLDDVEKHKTTLMKILDHLPLKVFLKDQEGKMLIVNKKLLEIHQTSLSEIIGKSDFDFFADDYSKAKSLWDAEQEIIKSGNTKHEIYEEKINNSGIILDSKLYPFFIDYLDETGILGIQEDISEITEKNKLIEKLEVKLKKK